MNLKEYHLVEIAGKIVKIFIIPRGSTYYDFLDNPSNWECFNFYSKRWIQIDTEPEARMPDPEYFRQEAVLIWATHPEERWTESLAEVTEPDVILLQIQKI